MHRQEHPTPAPEGIRRRRAGRRKAEVHKKIDIYILCNGMDVVHA